MKQLASMTILAGAYALAGCNADDASPAGGGTEQGTTGIGSTNTTADTSSTEPPGGSGSESSGESSDDRTLITHNFGSYTLDPAEETQPCVQWTLSNDQPVYAQAVQLSNRGFFHHSNWFIVPEGVFEGEDGYFNCSERGFTEVSAALQGSVLFAQSTQSYVEEQRTLEGAVVKIPEHYKVIGSTHLLNVTPAEVETDLWMSFELVHPRLVDVLLTPFRLTYFDLQIPADAESRFTGECTDMAEKYEARAGTPFNLKLHYVLPHFHYLGNYFRAEISGGARDGEEIVSTVGFNGQANGRMFDPPLDLSGSEGVRFTCGYDNWTDTEVGWGIGDQEMCVMLGLAEADVLLDTSVTDDTEAVGMNAGVLEFEGPCGTLALPKNAAQSMPTQEEIDGEFYIPPIDPADADIPAVPECVDAAVSATPTQEPTLENLQAVFVQSCSFNSCHGRTTAAGQLNLEATDLHAALVGPMAVGDASIPLVDPGNPEGSFLYQKMAQCSPSAGNSMPLNAPILLSNETVALVREWIAAGAPAG
ncbi:MAG: hypothetical protein KUG77_27960 [Nannocystaceae bacterium]|nr:hypothetical protein [Nannocystaceae bacterium]